MKAHHALLFCLLLPACAAPTLAQRQDAWRKFRDGTVATCKVGKYDPAMPDDVRPWCVKVVEP